MTTQKIFFSQKPANQTRVLVIDNNKHSRQTASTILGIGGYRVVAVPNGVIASGQLKKIKYDYILMNIKETPLTTDLIRTRNREIPVIYYSEQNLRNPSNGLLNFTEALYPLQRSLNSWGISNLLD